MRLLSSLLKLGVSTGSLLVMGAGIWILYSFPVDADVMRQFNTGLQLPRPAISIATLISELLFLHWLWRVQGKKSL